MVYKIKITGHEIKDDKVTYTIHVINQTTTDQKIFKYRYSQLKDIHQELEKLLNKLKLPIILPQFPKRKLFGATNKSEEAVIERKKELTMYLNELILIEKLYNLDAYRKSFLPDAKKKDQIKTTYTTTKTGQINMQICIDRYTLVQDVVIYYVRLKQQQQQPRDLVTHQQWTFKTRYSDLRNVHEALEQSKVRFLPPFPKRKIFGITNDSPEQIEKRREQLERYFNEIFTTKEIANTEVIKFFVDDSKKQAEREIQLEKMRKEKKQKSQSLANIS